MCANQVKKKDGPGVDHLWAPYELAYYKAAWLHESDELYVYY